jgi:hypothetical protein
MNFLVIKATVSELNIPEFHKCSENLIFSHEQVISVHDQGKLVSLKYIW